MFIFFFLKDLSLKKAKFLQFEKKKILIKINYIYHLFLLKKKIKLVFYVRRTRVFNKSKFSRNRQTAKSIFYFAVLINVLVIFLLLTYFIEINIKLLYSWYLFFLFIFFILFSFFIKNVKFLNINYALYLNFWYNFFLYFFLF